MALKVPYEIRCSCNMTFIGNIFEYVFAEHDPELKDSILSGDFNLVTCPSCGQGIPVENRFLYRDEKNKLWVWVCKRDEEQKRDALDEELIDKNGSMEFHFLDEKEAYRRYLVFGREGLLELLLREDPLLKRREGRTLKINPAHRLILEGSEERGYLFLKGEKIRVSIPLRFSEAHHHLINGPEGKKKWLQCYSQGINIHNPYSSFLDGRLRLKWNRIRQTEPKDVANNEFEDFAESWAGYKIDGKWFTARYPERYGLIDEMKRKKISRRIRSLNAKLINRVSR